MEMSQNHKLSIIVPCYNEEKTLRVCVDKVRAIEDDKLNLEIIIVNDASTDKSIDVANELSSDKVLVISHEINKGKGAAIRSGIEKATGDFIAIQDADLEYDPKDLKKLIEPLINGDADVVFGSRFLASGAHRVLYFWHSLGNKFLTFLSNMFTDLNLTDMETCYKVFKREVIQDIEIKEDRFGFEPEIVAKIAQKRLRIYEMGISYRGRTYSEGKKIGMKDGLRALYCIFRYNAHKAPVPIQFLIYFFIGGLSAIVNLVIFLSLFSSNVNLAISALSAYFIAAFVNYFLCIAILFRHKVRWSTIGEIFVFALVVAVIGLADLGATKILLNLGATPMTSKLLASAFGLVLNFVGRRYLVFPENSSGPWRAQNK